MPFFDQFGFFFFFFLDVDIDIVTLSFLLFFGVTVISFFYQIICIAFDVGFEICVWFSMAYSSAYRFAFIQCARFYYVGWSYLIEFHHHHHHWRIG